MHQPSYFGEFAAPSVKKDALSTHTAPENNLCRFHVNSKETHLGHLLMLPHKFIRSAIWTWCGQSPECHLIMFRYSQQRLAGVVHEDEEVASLLTMLENVGFLPEGETLA